MRNLFCGLVAAAMLFFVLAADADTPAPTKSTGKSTTKKAPGSSSKAMPVKPAATKAGTSKAATATTKSTANKAGKKSAGKRAMTPAPTWRNRQAAPSADRYKEIQQALVAKGYLKPEEVTGAWDQNSTEALKKFQTDQKLESSGKINSLSLIALGLGPKHTADANPPAAVPAPTEAK